MSCCKSKRNAEGFIDGLKPKIKAKRPSKPNDSFEAETEIIFELEKETEFIAIFADELNFYF